MPLSHDIYFEPPATQRHDDSLTMTDAFTYWPSAYRSQPEPMPPPLHHVFFLRCKQCDTFFSNRGMRAVLLLRPGLSLYSTDALPSNCSPIAYRPVDDPPDLLLRTCECLTQTLHCHGCGSNVGYMIVAPCQRCTASGTNSERSANGHRFVFHSTDIVASMRKFPASDAIPPIKSSCCAFPPSPLPLQYGSNESPTHFSSTSLAWPLPTQAATQPFPVALPRERAHQPNRQENNYIYWHQLRSTGEIHPVVE